MVKTDRKKILKEKEDGEKLLKSMSLGEAVGSEGDAGGNKR